MPKSMMMLAAMLGATAAVAQVSQADLDHAQKVRACDAIARKSARYACYDKIDQAPRAPVAATAPSPVRAAQADFGAESVPADRRARQQPALPEQIVATAVSARDGGIGHWTVTLDSGARWQMIERDPAFVPPKPGQAVRIRRVALGGFLLFVGQHPGVRVQRIS